MAHSTYPVESKSTARKTPNRSLLLPNGHESSLEFNRLFLIAMGDTGWLFVNGRLEPTLDLNHNLEAGRIDAMAGFYNTSDWDVDFRNFTVWAPQPPLMHLPLRSMQSSLIY